MRLTPFLLIATLLAGPAALPAQAAGDEDYNSPISKACQGQINRNQCYCLAGYIRLNGGEYIEDIVFIKLINTYPMSSKQTIGEDLHLKIPYHYEALENAVPIFLRARELCAKWPGRN